MSALEKFRSSVNQPHRSGRSSASESTSTSSQRLSTPDLESVSSSLSLRHHRDDSVDDDAVTLATKRLKRSALEICRRHCIPENSLDSFCELGSTALMLLDLKADFLGQKLRNNKDAHAQLLDSADFRSRLQDRLTACLLSPNLTAYVTDLALHVMKAIKDDPAVFKVPAEVFEDHESRNKLGTLVKELLTLGRSAIKQKIAGSLGINRKELNISELTRSLAPSGIEITTLHWSRVAFLRQSLVYFTASCARAGRKTTPQEEEAANGNDDGPQFDDDIPIDPVLLKEDAARAATYDRDIDSGFINNDEESGGHNDEQDTEDTDTDKTWNYKPNKFWNYVDDELGKLRKFVRKNSTTAEEQDERLTEFFTQCFQDDLKKYPGTLQRKAAPIAEAWQSCLQDKLQW